MLRYEYRPDRAELAYIGTDQNIPEPGFWQWSRNVLRRPVEEAPQGPVNRSGFVNSHKMLDEKVYGLDLELYADHKDPDARFELTKSAIAPLLTHGIIDWDKVATARHSTDETAALIRSISYRVRTDLREQALEQAWWLQFSDSSYSHNPFDNDPTEQVVIGADQPDPVTIYNFSRPLHNRHLRELVGAIDAMSTTTEGHSLALVPNIVIHDAFTEQFFARSKRFEKAGGQAWPGLPFIEISGNSLSGPKGSVGQTWLQQLYGHEITHQIGAAVNPHKSGFSKYFNYHDYNHDGVVDAVSVRRAFAGRYTIEQILASAPARDYGYTDAGEGMAVTGEEVPFGGRVDPLRHDAYMEITDEFIAKKERTAARGGLREQLLGRSAIQIEYRPRHEVVLPRIDAIDRPIRINFELENRSIFERIRDFIKA